MPKKQGAAVTVFLFPLGGGRVYLAKRGVPETVEASTGDELKTEREGPGHHLETGGTLSDLARERIALHFCTRYRQGGREVGALLLPAQQRGT